MKEFLVRIGIVVHWTGFCLGILMMALGFYMGFTTNGGALTFLQGTAGFFVFTSIGWVLRWILTGGKISFEPYK